MSTDEETTVLTPEEPVPAPAAVVEEPVVEAVEAVESPAEAPEAQPAERIPVAIDVVFEPGLAAVSIERARAVGDGEHMVVVAVDALVAGALAIQLLETGDFDIALGADSDDAKAVAAVEPGSLFQRWHTVSVDNDLDAIFAPDLAHLVHVLAPTIGDVPLQLAGLTNARPWAAQLAQDSGLRRVILVCAGDAGRIASDDVLVAGALIRTLLEELDHAPQLSDAAGIAVGVTAGTREHAGLEASDQGRRLLRQPDGVKALALCAQRDTAGHVPRLLLRDGVPRAVQALFVGQS